MPCNSMAGVFKEEVRTQNTEERPRENTGRGQSSPSLGEMPQKKSMLPTPLS